jgi:hypothetical protein
MIRNERNDRKGPLWKSLIYPFQKKLLTIHRKRKIRYYNSVVRRKIASPENFDAASPNEDDIRQAIKQLGRKTGRINSHIKS